MQLGEKIDGHFVSGHVDTTGEVVDILICEENKIIKVKYPEDLNKYIVNKGSITINGVSLTVIEKFEKNKNIFSFTLIPYSGKHTNLGDLKLGDLVNIEADTLGRYVVNYLKLIGLPQI